MKKWIISLICVVIPCQKVFSSEQNKRTQDIIGQKQGLNHITRTTKKKTRILGEEHISEIESTLFDNKYKVLFDYETLNYTTPKIVKYNFKRWRKINFLDIRNYDLYTYKQQSLYKIQDLGNEGTAVKYLYPNLNPYPGRVSGYNAFDIYKIQPESRFYYDTHGPLVDGKVVFANFGSFLFQLLYARSINKNWHISFTLDSLLADKEFVFSGRNERQTIAFPFSLNLHYKNDDETYITFLSFYRKKHRVHETGGISFPSVTANDIDYDYGKWLKYSNTSNNIYQKDKVFTTNFIQEYFLYQQYEFCKGLQIFNELKWISEANIFEIKKTPELDYNNNGDFPQKTRRTITYLSGKNINNARDVLYYKPFTDKDTLETKYAEVGIKGDLGKFFYETHYKISFLNRSFIYKGVSAKKEIVDKGQWYEHFIGGTLRYNFNDDNSIHIQGDVIYDDANKKERCFSVEAGYFGDFGELKYVIVKHLPSLVTQFYKDSSNFREWENDFDIQLDQQALLQGIFDFKFLAIRPYCSFLIQNNPVFFEKEGKTVISSVSKPIQKKGETLKSLYIGGLLGITLFNEWHLDTDIVKVLLLNDTKEIINNIPDIKLTTRFYYMHEMFDKRGDFSGGIEFNWSTPYYGDSYDPIVQQFYIQDYWEMYSFPLLSAFLNFRIDKFRGFFKVVNILQYANEDRWHYYATPLYPGQTMTLDFGFSWSLFN